jgi:putative protease
MTYPSHHRPELLAPAGDWEALRAAVANGADAVYFGLSGFNARHRATNFTREELPEVMAYLHGHNVRGYVAFNTLIFSDELEEAARQVRAIAAAGADALIVQDLGLARLVHRLVPGLPLHASTQMTLTEPRGIGFARRLGIERIILARELSAADIGKVATETEVPLEVFVHGALCVAYSGQCLTSEALGGRSANRGQCAQACRLPYEMLVDGRPRDLGDRAYLLSPQDLAAYDLIDELVRLGVACFKIEGRLKSAAYVAATTQTYRRAMDAALEGKGFVLSKQGRLDLEQSFSRGFSHGFLSGVNHQVLVQGRFPKSRGVRVGTVVGRTAKGVVVELVNGNDPIEDRVKPGDGVVFDDGHPEEKEQGGRVFAVHVLTNRGRPSPARRVELIFARGDVDPAKVETGSLVWKTDDPAFRKRMETTCARPTVSRRVPLTVHVRGRIGTALDVTIRDEAGHETTVSWEGPLQRAENHPLTEAALRETFGRLGDTPFVLGPVELDVPESVLVPKSVWNGLRRRAVALLQERREITVRHAAVEPAALEHWRAEISRTRPTSEAVGPPNLYVLVRTLEQLEAVLAWRPVAPLRRPVRVYCDLEDQRRYADAVARARAAGMPIGLASLRIVKPGEEGFLHAVARQNPDALLVRNLAAFLLYRELSPRPVLVGDFSLNVANELTADLLVREGLTRLVPSYDLNWEQLTAMLGRIDPSLFEIVIHQHVPMFHMEHCVYAAFLSQGKDWRDCGRPCDRHRVDLRDRVGAEFPVAVDAGCRNTVFNAVAQSAAEFLPRMLGMGLRHFRVELLRETAEQVGPLLETYARVLAGLDDGRGTWRRLQAQNQLGLTRGTLQLV